MPEAETFLKAGLSFQQLDEIALNQSDNEAARQLNQASTQRPFDKAPVRG